MILPRQWEETLPLGNGHLGMTPDGGEFDYGDTFPPMSGSIIFIGLPQQEADPGTL